jgi:pimeloyl-ACP methyl ester carboxylesterase
LTIQQNGRRLSYQVAGPVDGPVVVLLHGLVSDSTTWQPTLSPLAALGLRVIAMDLLGHGQSDKPPIGYSLDDFAASISAFLLDLGVGRVTLVGHSLGGAIAMQFAHSYPKQTARIGLVASGGLGKQVHLLLRGATLPGVSGLLRLTVNHRTARVYRAPHLHRALRLGPDAVTNLSRIGRSLVTGEGRTTFIAATRAAITPTGQRGNMIEMDYVARKVPTLIVWADRDPIIPVSHAHATLDHLPNSRLVLFEGRTHEPHRREPERFAETVADFIAETDPA